MILHFPWFNYIIYDDKTLVSFILLLYIYILNQKIIILFDFFFPFMIKSCTTHHVYRKWTENIWKFINFIILYRNKKYFLKYLINVGKYMAWKSIRYERVLFISTSASLFYLCRTHLFYSQLIVEPLSGERMCGNNIIYAI